MTQNDTHQDVVVALDIGTTKVCAIAGKMTPRGKLEVLGVGKVESVGVLRGVVSNIEKTVNAIQEAIKNAERTLGHDIKRVHVGIAGQHIRSLQHRGLLTRENTHNEISHRDIEQLIDDMHKLVLPPGDKIIHVIPQEYTVDSERGITDPIGMSGIRLEANFHIITGQITAAKNIHKCVQRAGLDIASLTLEPIASAEAILSPEEREAGIALVDIGGGTTDLAIFHEGIIRHTAVIPFGGNVITSDIKQGCKVMKQQAEKLKVRFGSAMASRIENNRIITVPGLKGQNPTEISERNLALIIQARIEEIFDHVFWEIRSSGYDRKLVGGIVLTGGGALLQHIDDLVAQHTGLSTRIGRPVDQLASGYQQDISSPIYSTAIGLLLNGSRYEEEQAERKQAAQAAMATASTVGLDEEEEDDDYGIRYEDRNGTKSKTWLDNLFQKTKEFFDHEPDKDF